MAATALVASTIALVAPAGPAAAAPALSCINTIYLTNGADQSVRSLDLATGTVTAAPLFPVPAGAAGTNQLGIGAAGAAAYYGTSTNIVTYVAASEAVTSQPKPQGVAGGTVGAVNPEDGLFYYGSFASSTLRIFVFDPATGTGPANPVASITVPNNPGANGDIAFDKAGRLYIVAGSGTAYALYVAPDTIPTTNDGTTTGVLLTATELARGTTTAATNGIAFASDGHLYLGSGTSVQKANPITGATLGSPIAMTGVTSNDLATCANPSTLQVTSSFPNGKRQPADSTTLVVEGGSYGAQGTGPDFTPSAVNPDGSSGTDLGVVLPGETYTVRQVGTGTTDLSIYSTTWECRDLEGAVVASGTGSTASYSVPTGTDGSSVVCAFINALRPPTAVPDTASVTFGTASVTLDGAANDTPGTGAIRPALTVFTDPTATDGGKRLVTPEGTWTIGEDGRITFAPAPGYSGTTPAVEYRITDEDGLTATSTATVTVAPGPSATPDTASTSQGAPVDLMPLRNDTAGGQADGSPATIATSSLTFPPAGQPAGSSASADGRTLTVPGEGVYVIDPATGAVKFTPEPTFSGTAQPVAYAFTDSVGNPSGSTITITVTAVGPTASPDTASTPFDTPVTLDVIDNDAAGPGGAIDPAATVFTDPAATDGGKRLVTGEGTWEIGQDGAITFTPADGYVGTTPPVGYRITDGNGQTAESTATVTVRPGPSATPDTGATDQNVDVVIPLLTNDAPGRRADDTAGAFDPSSVRLLLPATPPAGTTVSADGRRLTVPGEGVYTVDPIDGRVTFDPAAGFSGNATPIGYEVDDQAGNTATSSITVTVRPIAPVLTDDAVKTPGGVPLEFAPLANDAAGAPSAPLVPGSVIFTPSDATDGGTSLETPEGSWRIDDEGRMRFEPAPGFEGVTAPVEYEVRDANGTSAVARVSVTVGGSPLAVPDAGTTKQGQPIEVTVLQNDRAGDLGAPCDAGETDVPAGCDSGELLPSSVVFPTAGQPAGSTAADGGKTLTVPGEGVYAIDPATGVVTLTPEPAFAGTANRVAYAVTDSLGSTVSATVTITVTPVAPTADDDTARTPFDTPVAIDLLANDAPGDEVVPLVAARTVFPAEGQPAGAVVSDGGKTLTVPGEGVFVIADDGSATFTPAPGFTGTTAAVTYRIEDANGTTASATARVTVSSGPIAAADRESTRQGIDVTVSPLDNDTPSRLADDSAGEWDGASVVFPPDGQPAGATVSDDGKTLVVPGQGRYTIDADGDVTFQPEPAFTGTAAPIVYTATDSIGNAASAIIEIDVVGIVPTAADDRATTPYGTPVTFDIVDNDEAGDPAAPLAVDSAIFTASGIPAGLQAEIRDAGKTLDIAGQGVFTLQGDGTVTFTPADGFHGSTTPVGYTISDANGTTATAQLAVTVQPGPVLADDEDRTPQGIAVTLAVLDNDLAGLDADGERGALDPGSVVFPAEGQRAGTVSDGGKTLTVPGEGVYTVDPDTGAITFAPEAQFVGAATPVLYSARDSLGGTGTAILSITVQGPDPVARDNSATTARGTPVTIDVLANDTGANGIPLDPSSLALVDADQELVLSLSVSGEGEWKVVDGTLVFTPLPDFSGTTTPVTYSIADVAGARTTAQAVVTVTPSPAPPTDRSTDGGSSSPVIGALPATGADVPWIAASGAVLLLLAGLALMIVRRRRGGM